MKPSLLFLICVLFTAISLINCEDCCDCCSRPDLEFAGEWLIVEASREGVQQKEWIDTQLDIVHSGITNGYYLCPSSLDTTIWRNKGYWDIQGDTSFYRLDDDIFVRYELFDKNDQMRLTMKIPTKEQHNCGVDSACSTVVLKYWIFGLKRNE